MKHLFYFGRCTGVGHLGHSKRRLSLCFILKNYKYFGTEFFKIDNIIICFLSYRFPGIKPICRDTYRLYLYTILISLPKFITPSLWQK